VFGKIKVIKNNPILKRWGFLFLKIFIGNKPIKKIKNGV
jgi:hypothetical protein